VVESLGRHLLGKLRTGAKADRAEPDSAGAVTAGQPWPQDSIDEGDLTAALGAATAGGAAAVDGLSLLLIEVDRTDDVDLGTWAVRLLSGASPSLWRNLDLAARRTWWDIPDWARTARERIGLGDPSVLALVVASFHPTGYVREAAVARLGEVDDPAAVQALALRAADWVPQVRERARAALVQRVSSSVESLMSVGPLAVLFADREQGTWLFTRLEESAARLDDSDLRRLLTAGDWRLRRVAYVIALRDQRLARVDLIDAAAHDGDLVIRVQCADEAIRDAVAADQVSEVRSLATSGTAAVRAAAVSALARTGQVDVAYRALEDRNPMVREIAQAAVRRAGADPAERYRNLVGATNPSDPAAVAGLGETGTNTDAALIGPSLQHPVPRGRVEAVRALRRLSAVDLPTLVGMIDDPSPAVTRQVVATLAPYAGDIDAERLALLLADNQDPHVRTAAYRLLRVQDLWTRLLTDLDLYDDPDDDLRTRARGDLFGWLDREAATAYLTPTGATAQRFNLVLRHAATSIGPARTRLLRFHLALPNTAS
jgi:HEAT repeat protein